MSDDEDVSEIDARAGDTNGSTSATPAASTDNLNTAAAAAPTARSVNTSSLANVPAASNEGLSVITAAASQTAGSGNSPSANVPAGSKNGPSSTNKVRLNRLFGRASPTRKRPLIRTSSSQEPLSEFTARLSSSITSPSSRLKPTSLSQSPLNAGARKALMLNSSSSESDGENSPPTKKAFTLSESSSDSPTKKAFTLSESSSDSFESSNDGDHLGKFVTEHEDDEPATRKFVDPDGEDEESANEQLTVETAEAEIVLNFRLSFNDLPGYWI